MLRALALACLVLAPAAAIADLNLGILLACQRYRAAMLRGDRAAAMAACTPEFARQWARVPDEAYRKLPRPGNSRIAAIDKAGGTAAVLSTTPAGPVRFVLVGGGFEWRIADMLRPGPGGEWTSVRQTLDAALTANDMMANLKRPHGDELLGDVTPAFARELAGYPPADFARVRRFMPQPKLRGLPTVRIGERDAEVRAALPRGVAGGGATVRLKPADGWKVDDFALRTPRLDIPSFRAALPSLIAATAFAEYAKRPAAVAPASFTVPGKLRDALEYAATLAPTPFPKPGEPARFAVTRDGVAIDYAARKVRMATEGSKLAEIVVTSHVQNGSVADLLLTKRDAEARFASLGRWWGGAKVAADESPLVAVSASTPAAETAAKPPAETAPAAKPAKAKRSSAVRLPAKPLSAADRRVPVRTGQGLAPAGMQRLPVRTVR